MASTVVSCKSDAYLHPQAKMFGRRRAASKLSFRLARGAIKSRDCERGCVGFNMNDDVEDRLAMNFGAGVPASSLCRGAKEKSSRSNGIFSARAKRDDSL